MKKKLLLVLFFTAFSNYAQTIVSTTPQKKKVILEEFTGINCQYCPSGHAIANTIKNANPSDVFIINIHVGGFSTPGSGQPDFRTSFGTAIANQSALTGYPAATSSSHRCSHRRAGCRGTPWQPPSPGRRTARRSHAPRWPCAPR